MKHTPGPWQSVSSRSYEWAINAPKGDPDTLSASWEELATVYGPEDDGRMGYLKGQANAYLIAAAPELYWQLKGLLDRHWDYLRDFEDLTEAYDAIAKAEGNA